MEGEAGLPLKLEEAEAPALASSYSLDDHQAVVDFDSDTFLHIACMALAEADIEVT